MSELNQDELDIINDILGNDEDDPIFGKQSSNSNHNIVFPPSKNPEISKSSFTSMPKSAPISPKLSVNTASTSNSNSNGVSTFSKVQKCTSVSEEQIYLLEWQPKWVAQGLALLYLV